MIDDKEIEEWLEEVQNNYGGESDDDKLLEYGPEFRPALVGMVTRCSFQDVLCYDYDRCIDVLMKQGMSYEVAAEHFSFNIEGAYQGERTPMVLRRVPVEIPLPDMLEVICEQPEEGEGEDNEA